MGKRNFAHNRNRVAYQTEQCRRQYSAPGKPQSAGDGRTTAGNQDKPSQPPRKPKEGDSD